MKYYIGCETSVPRAIDHHSEILKQTNKALSEIVFELQLMREAISKLEIKEEKNHE